MSTTITECREYAKEHGICWRHVIGYARELRHQDAISRDSIEGARKHAWELYLAWNGRSMSRMPFWRCGFEIVRNWLENTGRDFTSIRCYDLIAVEIGAHYPEWREPDAEEFWEWLFTPYVPRPSLADCCERAIIEIEQQRKRHPEPCYVTDDDF